jgi:hypothetical protein
VYARGEQKRYRHRIENGDKRQSEQPDRSLKVRGRRAYQLGEISHGADVRLGALALGVNLGFIALEAGERTGFALARRNDVNAIAALLVSDHHRTDGAAKPRRFLDGCVDLGDAPIEVGDGLTLDSETGLGVGRFVREYQFDGRHVIEVGSREEAEHADCVQIPLLTTKKLRRA